MTQPQAHHLELISQHRRNRIGAAPESPPEISQLPPKPPGMTWRDYVIMLLHIGSELEHGLMVQYLYAAYSLGGDHLTEKDGDLVSEWQELILTVAREEMGHLLTVQNLLCLLGGPITFERENYPWDSPFYPFPFRFEPLTRESLAGYVFAEMPGNFDSLEKHYARKKEGTKGAFFRDVEIPFLEKVAREWVEKDDARPVGEVYQLIHDILSRPDLIPDSDFRPDTFPLQASWDDWGRGYRPNPAPPSGKAPKPDNHKATIIIEQAATRTEALYAIREIAAQGENPDLRPRKDEEPSHFARFVEILQEYDRRVSESPGWTPTRPVPVNPITAVSVESKHAPPGTTPITCAASAGWADLFDCRYRMLLTYLSHTFRLAREVDPDEPNSRGAVMHRIFGEMYHLKAISGILVRMPLTDDPKDPRRAGPPFRMPYSLVLPPDEIDCWQLHRDIILNSQMICDNLLHPESDSLAVTPAEGEPYLRTLRNADRNALEWVDTVLGGLRANGGNHS